MFKIESASLFISQMCYKNVYYNITNDYNILAAYTTLKPYEI